MMQLPVKHLTCGYFEYFEVCVCVFRLFELSKMVRNEIKMRLFRDENNEYLRSNIVTVS